MSPSPSAHASSRNSRLGEAEAQFIGARNSFYMATVSETGWPYIQHRGGPTGFVRVLDAETLAFPSYDGNGMFKSLGNLRANPRVGLLFINF